MRPPRVRAALRAGKAVLEDGLSLDEIASRAEAYSEVLGAVLADPPSSGRQLQAVLSLHSAVTAAVSVAAARAGDRPITGVRRNVLKAYLSSRERGGQ